MRAAVKAFFFLPRHSSWVGGTSYHQVDSSELGLQITKTKPSIFILSRVFPLFPFTLYVFSFSACIPVCPVQRCTVHPRTSVSSSLQIRLAGELESCLTAQELLSVFICRVFHCPGIEVPAYILPCQEFVACDPSYVPSCVIFSGCCYKINPCCPVGLLPCWKMLGEL